MLTGRTKKKFELRLNASTYMSIRNLARKGSKKDFEDFLYRVCATYIAEATESEWAAPEKFLRIDGKQFECVCPNCGTHMSLDLEEVENDSE